MAEDEAGLLLYQGRIRTLAGARGVGTWIALRGNRILAVGRGQVPRRFRSAPALDLKGRTVLPAFTDAHAHLLRIGLRHLQLDLGGCAAKGEALRAVAARARALAPGHFIRGFGWDQTAWGEDAFPTHQELDAVAAAHPVYLERVDAHAVWVNSRLLKTAGVTAATPDPPGGAILRDARGDPTGILLDRARELLAPHLPPWTADEKTAALLEAAAACHRVGITSLHDAAVSAATLRLLHRLSGEGQLRLRVYAMLHGEEALEEVLPLGPRVGLYGGFLTVRAVKLFVDGALGSRGAALLTPYNDAPGENGLLLTDEETIAQVASRALSHGFQVCAHAIGDRAVRETLRAYHRLREAFPEVAGARLRVEHAQIVHPADLTAFGDLPLIASIQPTHATTDMRWAEARLGPERLPGAYAWRSLLKAGAVLAGGSDAPIEALSPLAGVYAAVTRQDAAGNPPGGFRPKERLTIREALDLYTRGAAYAAFEEGERGRLRPGALADLVVLSADPFLLSPKELLEITVDYTILDGAVVYAREGTD
ncbi:MAG: amidohydrolase [candidate division NC10 bacterium]|nr:amidohydrolase [candidate division NC10 bacterium]